MPWYFCHHPCIFHCVLISPIVFPQYYLASTFLVFCSYSFLSTIPTFIHRIPLTTLTIPTYHSHPSISDKHHHYCASFPTLSSQQHLSTNVPISYNIYVTMNTPVRYTVQNPHVPHPINHVVTQKLRHYKFIYAQILVHPMSISSRSPHFICVVSFRNSSMNIRYIYIYTCTYHTM